MPAEGGYCPDIIRIFLVVVLGTSLQHVGNCADKANLVLPVFGNVIPALLASEACEQDQAGTQATSKCWCALDRAQRG